MDKNGETPIDALKREAREEANCIIEPKRLVGVYSIPSKDDNEIEERSSLWVE